VYVHLPRLAADLAILDVRLVRSPAGVEGDLDLLGAVGAVDERLGIGAVVLALPLVVWLIGAR